MLVRIVMHDHTARSRVDGNVLDARDGREGLADLPQQVGIALRGRDLHTNPPPYLMRNVKLGFCHHAFGANDTAVR
jgi:hypothetical protein